MRYTEQEYAAAMAKRILAKKKKFRFQLMDRVTREIVHDEIVEGWREAHKIGVKIMLETNDDIVCRIYDPEDVSIYDFITKERARKVVEGGNYNGNEKDNNKHANRKH